jgi:ABC-type Mn2+/Zn2+ transport system permease subunit
MAFIGDALPHASFGGVAVAFALGENLYVGGGIAAVITALLIGFISRRGLIRNDTAIGILFVGAFALGILVVSREDNYTGDLFAFVFGNVLAVSWGDVWLTAGVGAAVIAVVLLFYKELLFNAFDPAMAEASGLPVAALQYGLLVLLALVTVIALQTVGIVLVVALLVTPAATAQLLTRSLAAMMALGAALGLIASVVGLYLAWHADVSASASIVLTATAFFIAAFLFAPGRGLLWQGGPRPA